MKLEPFRQRWKIGIAKARYSPTTPMETTALKATGTGAPLMSTVTRAGRVSTIARAATSMTLYSGTSLLFSRVQKRAPGTAPSRLKANSIRVVEVMQAMAQKHCPTVEMTMTRPTHGVLSAWLSTATELPPAALTALGSWIANSMASSRIQPPIDEYRIACQMPLAAELEAPTVSSDMWQEAS